MWVSVFRRGEQDQSRVRHVHIPKVSFVVGSAADCDLVIADDPDVAPHHVRIEKSQERRTKIEPLAPTSIRGKPTLETVWMEAAAITIGSTRLCEGHVDVTLRRPPPVIGLRTNPPAPTRPPLPPHPHRAVLSDDAEEHQLLARLRDRADDEDARGAYATWLEADGRVDAARFVRHRRLDVEKLLLDTTPAWRALVTQAQVLTCQRTECEPWHRLTPTEDERLRHCGRCDRPVRYLTRDDDPATYLRHTEHEHAVVDVEIPYVPFGYR